MVKKTEKPAPPAAGNDETAKKIAGLEAKIEDLNRQLQEAQAKTHVDPDLVDAFTKRISSLETKLEEAEKLRKIELPAGDPPEGDPKGKKPAKKKSSDGVGMFS